MRMQQNSMVTEHVKLMLSIVLVRVTFITSISNKNKFIWTSFLFYIIIVGGADECELYFTKTFIIHEAICVNDVIDDVNAC